jgi:hypothetical protein
MIIYVYMYIIIIRLTTFIYGFKNARVGILDYLREGFPWPTWPFKHTESNSFKHTATTFKLIQIYKLEFHTSWASRSGPPSTCLNCVTVGSIDGKGLYDHVT